MVQLTRLPLRYKGSPELMQLITMVLAGVPMAALKSPAFLRNVTTHVWIENVRFAGNHADELAADEFFPHNCLKCSVILGDAVRAATTYELLGVVFNHANHTANLTDKFRSKLTVSLKTVSVRDLEVAASCFLYGAAILGIPLVHHYFFLKAARC